MAPAHHFRLGSAEPSPALDSSYADLGGEAQKGPPLIGLRFMWNLKKDGSEWSGGSVFDPKSGKTYRCFVETLDDGKRLKVRGYLGVSLLGRTQYWIRAKGPTG